ncbi:MAG: [FeFe] hydrogenase, group A [Planctomycetota bacterium]
MPSITINEITVEVPDGTTILEAARQADVEIPTLCKHPDLLAGAGCGICVVRIEGANRLIRACCTPVSDGMRVQTHTADIVAVRRTVLEAILSDHPNECLTCGRNGTCELQKLAADFGIQRQWMPSLVRDLPLDTSTGSIVLDPRKCVKCGRCIHVCQDKQDVWALSFLERGLETRISPAGDIALGDSPCIRCGQCSAHCPVGAILEYDQTQEVWAALNDPDTVCIAQIAPAVRVSVGESFGYPPGANLDGQIYSALRRMGFDTVFDTTFGADVTIMEEASELVSRLQEQPERLPLITTCCPSWVDFMEKFHHDMIDHFSSCKSPHAILGTLTKTWYAEQAGIDPARICMVSIMPCTSKKYEIIRHRSMFASGEQDVDVSITTREFVRMIKQSGVRITDLPCLDEPDDPMGEHSGAGTIFGATGGVMEAALRTAHNLLTGSDRDQPEFPELRSLDGVKYATIDIAGRELRVAVAHGCGHVETVLDQIRNAPEGEPPFHFVEVMACPGGCIGGGGQAWRVSDATRAARAAGLHKDDRVRSIRCSHANPSVQRLYREFLGEPRGAKAHELLHTTYQARPQYLR